MEIHNTSFKILTKPHGNTTGLRKFLKNAQKFTAPIRKFFQIGIEIHTS